MMKWWICDGNQDARDETRREIKKLVKNPLREPFTRSPYLHCSESKLILSPPVASSHLMREQKVVGTCDAVASPYFHQHSRLLRCAKKKDFTSLIRWISRELLWKRIFNCPGNSEWSCIRQHPGKGNFYTWFLVKSIIKQKRSPLFSPNEETFMKRGESSMALYECEMEVGSIQANTQFFRWSNKKFC